MDCLIALTALCLFDPANIRIEADMSWQLSGDFYYRYAGQEFSGPVGRFALKVKAPITRNFDLAYGIEHRSILETNDRGEERAFLGFTWRPFGHE